MEFFIDTANVAEIKKAYEMGLIDGVTTNPSLIAREGKEFLPLVKEILSIVKGPVSLEVISTKAEEMIKEGKKLAKLGKNVVVKIPMTLDGLKATKSLASEGVNINVTLVFSPAQALLAAKAGAAYVSPFVGRLDDVSHNGMELIEQIVTIFRNYSFQTKVLVASVRNPLHVVQSALIGADVATIPYAVIEQLSKHPLTDAGLKKFLSDWEKVPKK